MTIEYSSVPQDGSGGALTAEGLSGAVVSGETTAQGAQVTFTAAPVAGYLVEGWSEEACLAGAADEDVSCELTASGNLDVTVTFAPVPVAVAVIEYSATPEDGSGGVLTAADADGAALQSGDEIAQGTRLTFTAAPQASYYVSGWTGACDGVGEVGDAANPAQERECALTASADIDVAVIFAQVPVAVATIDYTAIPEDGSGGALTAEGVESGGTVAQGAQVTFTATPAAGYLVEGWSEETCLAGEADAPVSCELTASGNLDVTVTFALPPARVITADEVVLPAARHITLDAAAGYVGRGYAIPVESGYDFTGESFEATELGYDADGEVISILAGNPVPASGELVLALAGSGDCADGRRCAPTAVSVTAVFRAVAAPAQNALAARAFLQGFTANLQLPAGYAVSDKPGRALETVGAYPPSLLINGDDLEYNPTAESDALAVGTHTITVAMTETDLLGTVYMEVTAQVTPRALDADDYGLSAPTRATVTVAAGAGAVGEELSRVSLFASATGASIVLPDAFPENLSIALTGESSVAVFYLTAAIEDGASVERTAELTVELNNSNYLPLAQEVGLEIVALAAQGAAEATGEIVSGRGAYNNANIYNLRTGVYARATLFTRDADHSSDELRINEGSGVISTRDGGVALAGTYTLAADAYSPDYVGAARLTFQLVLTEVTDLTADNIVAPAARHVTLDAAPGYFGRGYAIPVANTYALTDEVYDSVQLGYDEDGNVISILEGNPVPASGRLILVLAGQGECADAARNCNAVAVSVTVVFQAALSPQQDSAAEDFLQSFTVDLKLPDGYAAADSRAGRNLSIVSPAYPLPSTGAVESNQVSCEALGGTWNAPAAGFCSNYTLDGPNDSGGATSGACAAAAGRSYQCADAFQNARDCNLAGKPAKTNSECAEQQCANGFALGADCPAHSAFALDADNDELEHVPAGGASALDAGLHTVTVALTASDLLGTVYLAVTAEISPIALGSDFALADGLLGRVTVAANFTLDPDPVYQANVAAAEGRIQIPADLPSGFTASRGRDADDREIDRIINIFLFDGLDHGETASGTFSLTVNNGGEKRARNYDSLTQDLVVSVIALDVPPLPQIPLIAATAYYDENIHDFGAADYADGVYAGANFIEFPASPFLAVSSSGVVGTQVTLGVGEYGVTVYVTSPNYLGGARLTLSLTVAGPPPPPVRHATPTVRAAVAYAGELYRVPVINDYTLENYQTDNSARLSFDPSTGAFSIPDGQTMGDSIRVAAVTADVVCPPPGRVACSPGGKLTLTVTALPVLNLPIARADATQGDESFIQVVVAPLDPANPAQRFAAASLRFAVAGANPPASADKFALSAQGGTLRFNPASLPAAGAHTVIVDISHASADGISGFLGAAAAQISIGVFRALNPDEAVAQRTPNYRAVAGYFGPGHQIKTGDGYDLESESYDSAAMSYDANSRFIGILESNPVAADAPLRLAVTAAVVCTAPDDFCRPLNLTVTASFTPVTAPQQPILRALQNQPFDPRALALPAGFDGPTIALAGVSAGGDGVFHLNANSSVALTPASAAGAAEGVYEITAHITHGQMLGTLALVVTAEIVSRYAVNFAHIPADGRGGALQVEAQTDGATGPLNSGALADGNSLARFQSRAQSEWHVVAWSGDAASCPPGEARLSGAVQNCDVPVVNTAIYVTVTFGRDECVHANPCEEGEVCVDSNLQADGGTSCQAHYQVDYGVVGRRILNGALVETGGGNLAAAANGAPLAAGESAPSGATVTLTATPEPNYYASAWSGCDSAARVETGDDDDGAAKDCVLVISADSEVSVSFARRMRDVRIAESQNGDILGGILNGESFLQSGAPDREYQIAHGLNALFTARPAAGYYVAEWGGDCAADQFNGATGAQDEGGDTPYESAIPQTCSGVASRDLNVSAIFAKIPLESFTVTLSPSEGGTILAEMTGANYAGALATLQSGDTAEDGAWLRFSAVPENDYRFDRWTSACDGKDILNCRLRATINATVGAVFAYNRNECQYYAPPTGDPVVNGGCAPTSAGGVCVDPDLATRNDTQCSCASGYLGDGIGADGCHAERTVNFDQPENGALSAVANGAALSDAAIVANGVAVTFTAAPARGYYVANWTNDCQAEPNGDPGRLLLPGYDPANDARECVRIAQGGNLQAGAVFARQYYSECAENPFGAALACDQGEVCRDPSVLTEGDAVCVCAEGFEKVGEDCVTLPTVIFNQPENGLIRAERAAEDLRSLQSVPFGAAITFFAIANEGYFVRAWTNACATVAVTDDGKTEQSCVLTAGDASSAGALMVGAEISLALQGPSSALPEGVAESGDVALSDAACAALGGTAFAAHDDFTSSIKGCRDSAATECLYESDDSENSNCQPFFNRLRDCLLRSEPAASVPRGFLCDASDPAAAAPAPPAEAETVFACLALRGVYSDQGEFSTCSDYGASQCYLSLCAPLFAAVRACNTAGQTASNGACGQSCGDDLAAAGGLCVSPVFAQPANGTLRAVRNGQDLPPTADVRNGDVLIFTATPAAGHYVSAWSGDCIDIGGIGVPAEGAVDKTCSLTADSDPQVGVAFAEFTRLDECDAANPCHAQASCADPDLFAAGSALECACNQGYGGDGRAVCDRLLVTLTFATDGADGQVAAFAQDGAAVANGETVPLGERVTFVATPDAHYYVSAWTGHCDTAGQTGHENDAESLSRNCVLLADENLAATAVFDPRRVDECAANSPCGDKGICTDPYLLVPGSALECACDAGHTQSAPGQPCLAPLEILTAETGAGTVSATSGGLNNINTVSLGATVIFIATPDAGNYVSRWTGDCLDSGAETGDENDQTEKTCTLRATVNVFVGAVFAPVPTDECVARADECHTDAVCTDPNPLAENSELICACRQGYAGDGKTICQPSGFRAVFSAGAGGDIAATSGDSGRILQDGDDQADADVRAVFTALPNDQFYVSSWSGCESGIAQIGGHDDGGPKNCEIAAVNADLEITAFFAPQMRLVEFVTDKGDGAVAAASDGAALTSGSRVSIGVRVTFTAAPDEGYFVLSWRGCENGQEGSPQETGSKTCVARAFDDLDVGAQFLEVPTSGSQLPAGIPESGDVPDNEESCTAFGGAFERVRTRDFCSFSSLPASAGNRCVHGSNCGPVFNNIRNCNLANQPVFGLQGQDICGAECGDGTAARGAECIGRELDFLVRTEAGANGMISAATDEGIAVEHGELLSPNTNLVFTATPDAGYYVSAWTGCDLSTAQTGGHGDGGAKTCQSVLTDNLKVRAEFALRDRAVILLASPNGALSAASGGRQDVTRVAPGALVVFTAAPNAGYYVSNWQGCENGQTGDLRDGGEKTCESTANPTVSVVNDNLQVRALFAPLGRAVAAAVWSVGGGQVQARFESETAPGLGRAADGTRVTFIATPGARRFVAGWARDCKDIGAVGNSADTAPKQCVLTASRDLSVEAEFRASNPAVNIQSAANGGVVGRSGGLEASAGNSQIIPFGTTVTFTATPDIGYYVQSWIACPGGAVGTRVDTAAKICELTVNNDISAGAVFAERAPGSLPELDPPIPPSGDVYSASADAARHQAVCEAYEGTYNAGGFVSCSIADGSCFFTNSRTSYNSCIEVLGTVRDCNLNNQVAIAGSDRFEVAVCGGLCSIDDGQSAIGGRCESNKEPQQVVIIAPTNGAIVAEYVSGGGGQVTTMQEVPFGSTIRFTATPDSSYYVSGWSGCSGGETGSAQDPAPKTCLVGVREPLRVGATFVQDPNLVLVDELAKSAPDIALVERLLDRGASPDGIPGQTPPIIALVGGSPATDALRAPLVSLLIVKGADVNATNAAGNTAPHQMANSFHSFFETRSAGMLEMMRHFIAANNLSGGKFDWTALGVVDSANLTPLSVLSRQKTCGSVGDPAAPECNEMSQLMRAAGAVCNGGSTSGFCGETRELITGIHTANAAGGGFSGGLITIQTPLAVHGVAFTLALAASKESELTADGWRAARPDANPRAIVLTRPSSSPIPDGEFLTVSPFTVSISSRGLDLGRVRVMVTARALSPPSRELLTMLATDAAATSKDYAAARLNLGVSPNAVLDNRRPILIVAGLSGNADVVGLLLGAPHQANPNLGDPANSERTLPHLIAQNAGNLAWTAARDVLRAFSQNVAAEYDYDWNTADAQGDSVLDELARNHAGAGAADQAVILEMAEFALNGGGECLQTANAASPVCIGDARQVNFAQSPNGALSAASAGGAVTDGDSLAHGVTVTLTAAPAAGYFVGGWTGACEQTGETGDANDAESKTCEVRLNADITAGAEFSLRLRQVNFADPLYGALSAQSGGADLAGGALIPHGAMVTFTAAPDGVNLYYVSAWHGCANGKLGSTADSAAKTCETTANSDLNVSAVFTNRPVANPLEEMLGLIRASDPDAVNPERIGLLLGLGVGVDETVDGRAILLEAALNRNYVAVSVLITAGANPAARDPGNNLRQVPHYVARFADNADNLKVLRHFISAINIVGYAYNWNSTSGQEGPLHIAALFHSANRSDHTREIVALIYERGGRCTSGYYCLNIPMESVNAEAADSPGDALTIVARDFGQAKFTLPLPDGDIDALAALGWSLRRETDAPERMVLVRDQSARKVAAVFTLTAFNGAQAVREYAISVKLAGAADDPSTALSGELAKASPSTEVVADFLNQGANPDGMNSAGLPFLLVAGAAGHGDAVSVLVAAGADPNALQSVALRMQNLAHVLAINGVNGVDQAPTIPWASALEVLRKFADALAAHPPATAFDWNLKDRINGHAPRNYSVVRYDTFVTRAADRAVVLEMAKFMHSQGGRCSEHIQDGILLSNPVCTATNE